MFHAYLRLFARHITWLERKYPQYMFAKRYQEPFKFVVGQWLRAPGFLILMFLPGALILFLEMSVPVSDNAHAMMLFVSFILFFVIVFKTLWAELKKPQP